MQLPSVFTIERNKRLSRSVLFCQLFIVVDCRENLLCKLFTKFNAPLIIGINAPHNTFNKGDMFIERNKCSDSTRVKIFTKDRGSWSISLKNACRNHPLWSSLSPNLISAEDPEKGDSANDIVVSGVDFNVKIPGRHNLATSRDRYQLTYWQNRSRTKLYSAAYAWVESKALLVAEWQQPDGYGYYPGHTNFFRDGNRIGQMRLDRTMLERSRQIMSFGEDPHTEVQYSIPPGYNIGNGLILKDRMEKRQTVSLHNLGKTARDVRLYARLPLATQTDVTVEPKFNPKPDQENVENVRGIVLWEKTLNAGDTLRIENSYDVRYPEGKRLVGID